MRGVWGSFVAAVALHASGVAYAEGKNYFLLHPDANPAHEPVHCQVKPQFFGNQRCPDVLNSDVLISGTTDSTALWAKAKISHGYEGREQKTVDTVILPVEHRRFEFDLYLRSGEGDYSVSLSFSNQLERPASDAKWGRFEKIEFTNLDRSLSVHLLPSEEVPSDDPSIEKLALELTEDRSTPIEKALAIHDFVATQVAYDVDTYQHEELWGVAPFDAIYILHQKKALCRGYSTLMTALLRAVKIPTRIVEGEGKDPNRGFFKRLLNAAYPVMNHSWVEAFIEARWIAIDASWDAGRLNQDRSEFEFSLSHEFFDFKKAHRPMRVMPY